MIQVSLSRCFFFYFFADVEVHATISATSSTASRCDARKGGRDYSKTHPKCVLALSCLAMPEAVAAGALPPCTNVRRKLTLARVRS